MAMEERGACFGKAFSRNFASARPQAFVKDRGAPTERNKCRFLVILLAALSPSCTAPSFTGRYYSSDSIRVVEVDEQCKLCRVTLTCHNGVVHMLSKRVALLILVEPKVV
jgi:hypothetical protein